MTLLEKRRLLWDEYVPAAEMSMLCLQSEGWLVFFFSGVTQT